MRQRAEAAVFGGRRNHQRVKLRRGGSRRRYRPKEIGIAQKREQETVSSSPYALAIVSWRGVEYSISARSASHSIIVSNEERRAKVEHGGEVMWRVNGGGGVLDILGQKAGYLSKPKPAALSALMSAINIEKHQHQAGAI